MNEITAIRPLTDEQALELISTSTLLSLQEDILDVALSRHKRKPRRRSKVALSGQRARRWVASGTVVAAALAAVLVISLSGHTPDVAHAFPILNSSSTITPAELSRSLLYYGVSPGNSDGIDLKHGHAVSTRWGTGYVLSNPRRTAICVVAPGLTSDGWGAACAPRNQAAKTGVFYEYAYDAALHTARMIGLLPDGATVTTTARNGRPHRVTLRHGVLAINISHAERVAVTIAHHTSFSQVTPKEAHPVYGSPSGPSSTTATTATGTTTTTRP
ncbi:MAG: hypothetical protein WAU75_24260 [Solirubrobacteraceae bacterium]